MTSCCNTIFFRSRPGIGERFSEKSTLLKARSELPTILGKADIRLMNRLLIIDGEDELGCGLTDPQSP